MIAVSPWSLHWALTGLLRGPETTSVRFDPPNASIVPSPPSARGWIRISWSSPRAVLIDSATVCADAVPLNLSGATRILIRGLQYHSSGGYRSDPKRIRTLASARSATGSAAGIGRTFAESTPIIRPTFLASSS